MALQFNRPGRSSRWMLVLMATSLVLLVALIWQSFQSAQTHLAAAERVLTDYARLAAEEFGRKTKGAVGYRVLHQQGSRLQGDTATRRAQVAAILESANLESDQPEPDALRSIATVFEFDPDRTSASVLYGRAEAPLIDAMSSALGQAGFTADPRSPFRVIHWQYGDQTRTTVIYPGTDRPWLGLDLDPNELIRWFAGIYQRETLLPATLAGDFGNQPIYIRLQDPQGRTLFDSGGGYDPYVSAEAVIGDDYGGLFAGFAVSASIDPALAPQLVIGGLPRSRLPVLLLLVALTLTVLVATFWLMIRDRALTRLRGQFVARVSHELRTPLTQIRMFAETLLLGRVTQTEKRREYLNIINREAQRLGHLVDNVLAFSGREKSDQSLVMEDASLDALLDEVVSGYGPLADARGDRLELDIEPELSGRVDREAFKQILLNLLDNACKYGPEGQTVQTRAWRKNDRVWIAVQDDGPGIPDREKRDVWMPYRRLAREERRAINGTGIGLSVARELIEAMGGDYRVEDAEGGGARFVISFPASAREPA